MKLAFKFAVSVAVLICIVLAFDGYIAIRSEVELHHSDVRRLSQATGTTLARTLQRISDELGTTQALAMLDQSEEPQSPLRVHWIEGLVPPENDTSAPGEGLSGKRSPGTIETYVPAVLGDQQGMLQISASGAGIDDLVEQRVRRQVVLTAVLVLATTVSVLSMGIRVVGHPIHALVDAVHRVSKGDLSPRLTLRLRGHDELSELADEFSKMCRELKDAQDRLAAETTARISMLEQLRHADRLATIGQLSAGIAHELGTPLNVVWGHAEMITGGEIGHDQVLESARMIASQSDRMTRIIRQLLDFARQSRPEKVMVDLHKVALEVREVVGSMARKQQVTIEVRPDCPAEVMADREQIQQVLINLVINGIQAMPAGGCLDIEIEPVSCRSPETPQAPESRYWRVAIIDHGVGIDPQNLDMIFNPFFTTKGVGEGTGLGLSIAYGIIREHNGWFDVNSTPGQGTRFALHLPQESSS